MKRTGYYILSILIIFSVAFAYRHRRQDDRILMSSIETLTFYKSKYTTGRRLNPIPQMKCLGGSAGCSYMPSTMQCYNRGSDGRNIQWECKAEVDKGVSLGETHVSCEGYEYSEDPYVLAGSCGVEFYLEKNGNYANHHNHHHKNYYNESSNSSGGFFETIVMIVMFVIVCYIIASVLQLNFIFSILGFILQIVFLPFTLLTSCCSRSGHHYPPPPSYPHHRWGNDYYHRDNYYYDSSSSSSSDDNHVSTSYASTSNR